MYSLKNKLFLSKF